MVVKVYRIVFIFIICSTTLVLAENGSNYTGPGHIFNGIYKGRNTERIAFPIGGIGAGMFCIEGSGAISHMSVRNRPDLYNEPVMFAALAFKGKPACARVLEGPVADWKKFGMYRSGKGSPGTDWGLARFKSATFISRFPFARIDLSDPEIPLAVTLIAWSPFIPTDAANSSLPVGALEYHFINTGKNVLEYVFSYHAENFMAVAQSNGEPGRDNRITPIAHGFVLSQAGRAYTPEDRGDFAIFTGPDDSATVDYCWFRGGYYDPLMMTWNHIREANIESVPRVDSLAPGASIYIPFKLNPGEEKTIRITMAWYVPDTRLRLSGWPTFDADLGLSANPPDNYYAPWYSGKFNSIDSIIAYWGTHYIELRKNSRLFSDAFYRSTLPPEVLEAVAANLTILKSPTVLRQRDGKFWGWEGCGEAIGSCSGSCTHVWNYAQALCHLFPALERTMRETEFFENQDSTGHQNFRAGLPIRPLGHTFYAAADGQLGGIMKVYREWRISGDSNWLRRLYPMLQHSLDYCIRTWDPRHTGTIEEAHHNTYDVELWGADPMCSSIYLGALKAFVKIGGYLGENTALYQGLFRKGKMVMENELYNGEYFYQRINWKGLSEDDPVEAAKKSLWGSYSPEALELLQKEGPKYQYGIGCLSDGVLGAWLAQVCGLDSPLDNKKVQSHLLSVYKYNFKTDLEDYSNPQRSTFALGREGGLLLCSWPKGGRLSIPFVYSNEVWTGIEYQVASHLIFTDKVKEGLEIVRACRKRYDGIIRNPFDEYECGHWYARALASYALIEGLTGVRYDAVEKTLYVHSRIGDFVSFLSTNSGFANVLYKNGKVSLKNVYGMIPIQKTVIMQ
jgi:uncharacterized protein (DUF608 family)